MSARVFYVFNDVPTTYSEFGALVSERAGTFISWHGRTIGLWEDNNPYFVINLFALWQAGAIPFLISRRLPSTIVSALLEKAQAHALLTPDPARWVGDVPAFSSVCGGSPRTTTIVNGGEFPAVGSALQTTALILHTSGTTTVPKLVRITRSNLLASLDFYYAAWENMWTGDDASLGSMPLFHVYGLYSELLHAYRMRCQYHFSGTNPYDILQALQKGQGKITLLFTVPWMVRQLLDIPGGPDALSRLRYVNLGGAALDETLGQRLDAGGIRIVQGYGMTELGAVLMSSPERGDWRNMHPVIPANFWHLDKANGQLIIHADCPTLALSSPQDFCTGDFFYPSLEGGYCYESRTEDILVHETGEKSNALAIELMLLAEFGDLIEHVAIIGNGRLRLACVMLWKAQPTAANYEQLLQGLTKINAGLPTHSHVQKSLLLLLLPEQGYRLPLTGKKTVARKKAEIEFQVEIEHLYTTLEPVSLGTSIESFFEQPQNLDRYVSLFNQGLDSVRAVALRNHIANLTPGRNIPLNVVYQYPTLDGLTRYLQGAQPSTRVPPVFSPFRQEEINQARWEYPLARHILLTGANGFVGRQLLETLSGCEYVEHIYCPVGKNPEELPPFRKVSYYPGYDFCDALLGLGPENYQALRSRVDTIIHGAWPVDFNITYEQMAASALLSLRHLIDFARQDGKTLHFLSSVVAVMLHPSKSRVDEEWPLPSPSACLPFGYAQTKWEAEQAVIRSGVRHKIHRLGQISGHTKTGKWDDSEHIPIVLRASQTFGRIPLLPLPIDWVPVDVACEVMVELMSVPNVNLHHIANPRPRPAECLMQGGAGLPLNLWLEKIEPHLDEHPSLVSIWPFLQEIAAYSDRLTPLVTDATCLHSPRLAACEPISDEYLARLLSEYAPRVFKEPGETGTESRDLLVH